MAQMYPLDIECLPEATEGEKKVFRFIKAGARPDEGFICWYEPNIDGHRPDFVLFGKEFGLLVLEVKDWEAWQIRRGDAHFFTVCFSGQDHQETNPEKQAKRYADRLMQLLRRVPSLRERDGKHQGKLKVPVARAVVFTNISEEEYTRCSFQRLIPRDKVLLKDDLDPCSEISCDPSGGAFRKRIGPMFPFPFQGSTNPELDRIKETVWPEISLNLPPRDGSGRTRFQTEVRRLDQNQARIALKLKRGHQIIKGPPGSGKTLVLVHRCCRLRKHDPRVKRVLFVCYNIALVSYIKRLIMENGVGLGDGVEVCHFYDLCSRILDEKIDYDRKDSRYYQDCIDLALDAVGSGQSHVEPFDAVLVDEGQDLSDQMVRAVLGLLKPGGDLVIALDPYQDIYKRKSSWKALGIQAKGHTRYLKKVYRSTREIFEFTQRFIGQDPAAFQQASLPFESAMHGPEPELIRLPGHKELEDLLVRDVYSQIKKGEFKRSEIAIIYDDKAYGPGGFQYDPRHSPRELVAKLEGAGIPTKWPSRDIHAKEEFDITTDRVTVISIHSAKGIDFDLVYLVGMDGLNVSDATRGQIIKTVYVAMTRAKYRLVIPYVHENELIDRIKCGGKNFPGMRRLKRQETG
ncbi:MAG: NERD domain-containing protein [Deltaproteobacteria bacterium]|nr:NERD domain-containing protein [Deltaproteobacteria bacterium]